MQNSVFSWPRVKEALKASLGAEVVERWFEPMALASVDEKSLVLSAPNVFFRDWVLSHYHDALTGLAGGRDVQLLAEESVQDAAVRPPGSDVAADEKRAEPAPATQVAASATTREWEHGLNPKLTFDRFVVGPSNRFAHAASLAVAESPAKAYNPLFVYGKVGLGKTHLMQAVGHAIRQRQPSRRVVYVSSERFTNELIAAIQTKTTTKFRDRYRTVDVLLIDDVHFIAEKEATQEEFFHTFNTLYDAHKQIVLSSDRSPKEIAGLEERLVSRFEWGLVTDVQAPDLETRTAILRKKAEESRVEVLDEVVDFIAQQITSNIRELEGALIRVIAYCTLFNVPQTAQIARNVLKDMVQEVRSRITVEEIQRRVAQQFHLEVSELCGSKRQRSVLQPRQLAMFLCRKLTDASLPEIGRAFGGRDHTTVMHAVEKIEQEVAQDIHKKQLIERLQESILASSRGGRE